MRRPTRVFSLLALVTALSACQAWHPVSTPVPELLRAEDPEVLRVKRAVDTTALEVWHPSVAHDTLRGHREETAIATMLFPLRDLQRVELKRFSAKRTVFLVLGVAAGAFAYDRLMSLNSCSALC